VVALSNGKDSRAVLHDALVRYPRRRVVTLYNHPGNEHEGSEAEAAALCRALEVPLLFTWKERCDGRLVSRYGPEVPAAAANLDLVVELAAARGQWADRANPLCTSTGKRDTSDVVMRGDDLVAHLALDRGRWPSRKFPLCTGRGKEQTTDGGRWFPGPPGCVGVRLRAMAGDSRWMPRAAGGGGRRDRPLAG
jgi:hypothetical protein